MKRAVAILSVALLLTGTVAMMENPADEGSESDSKPREDGEPLLPEAAPPVVRLEPYAELFPDAPDTGRRYSDINAHPEAVAQFPILLAESDPLVDYKILEAVPDPGVEYRMPVVDPVEPRVPDGDWNRILESFRSLQKKIESDDPQR
jgi:hypothetical protein